MTIIVTIGVIMLIFFSVFIHLKYVTYLKKEERESQIRKCLKKDTTYEVKKQCINTILLTE
jgi:hypothetical protein